MGAITQGIPKQIVVELARLNGSTVFVETGTFQGVTTRWASANFDIVHTIERAEGLYEIYSKELATLKGVTPHLGSSKDILPDVVKELKGQKAVYWLDGHWSGGETAGEKDECPLLNELACLSNRPEDIILIDDARYFLSAPPSPHDPAQWPTIADVVSTLPPKGQFVQVVDDVIFIIPNRDTLKTRLIDYARKRSNDFWGEFQKFQQAKSQHKTGVKGLLSKIAPRG